MLKNEHIIRRLLKTSPAIILYSIMIFIVGNMVLKVDRDMMKLVELFSFVYISFLFIVNSLVIIWIEHVKDEITMKFLPPLFHMTTLVMIYLLGAFILLLFTHTLELNILLWFMILEFVPVPILMIV